MRRTRRDYILGLPTYRTRVAKAAPWAQHCRWRWKPGLARVRRFQQFDYAAGSWSVREKVVYSATIWMETSP